MPNKERRTVSLDADADRYLDRDGVNASELVNKLVKQHMNGGASESEILEFRKKQIESEYEDLANRAQRKIEEYNELERRVDEATGFEDGYETELRDILEKAEEGAIPPKESPRIQRLAQEEYGSESATGKVWSDLDELSNEYDIEGDFDG